MIVRKNGEPHKIYTRAGGPYLGKLAAASTRIPSGHPEGFLEAFANIYTAAYDDMVKRERAEVRTARHRLPERLRRRGRDELHHAGVASSRGRRGVDAAEARGVSGVGGWRASRRKPHDDVIIVRLTPRRSPSTAFPRRLSRRARYPCRSTETGSRWRDPVSFALLRTR